MADNRPMKRACGSDTTTGDFLVLYLSRFSDAEGLGNLRLYDNDAIRPSSPAQRGPGSQPGNRMDLQTLLDERAIMHGLGRFARILDGREWDAVHEVFA